MKMWTDKEGTEYTLNWIPLGWFVRLKWEDPENEEEFLASDSLITASLWRKIVILLAGITMNFIATYLIFVTVFMVGVQPIQVSTDTTHNISYLSPSVDSLHDKWYTDTDIVTQSALISEILPNSWAAQQWLQSWDVVTAVNQSPVSVYTLVKNLSTLKDQMITVDVSKADWSKQTLSYTCQWSCQLGIGIARPALKTVSFGSQSWGMAWNELWYQSRSMLKGLGRIWSSLISFNAKTTKDWLKMMSGPAGVIKAWKDIANTRGWSAYLAFAWLISLSLALFNLLPIPALDGGRVVWSIIQAVGRFKPQKYFVIENYINMFFFIALMALWIYVLWQDLVRAWGLFGG
jgi:regulator of sigma E protease